MLERRCLAGYATLSTGLFCILKRSGNEPMSKTTFALFFGNRGFVPASLIASAREEMKRELNALGHEVLMLDADATRYGAVETPHEGEIYANFLRANRGK